MKHVDDKVDGTYPPNESDLDVVSASVTHRDWDIEERREEMAQQLTVNSVAIGQFQSAQRPALEAGFNTPIEHMNYFQRTIAYCLDEIPFLFSFA